MSNEHSAFKIKIIFLDDFFFCLSEFLLEFGVSEDIKTQ